MLWGKAETSRVCVRQEDNIECVQQEDNIELGWQDNIELGFRPLSLCSLCIFVCVCTCSRLEQDVVHLYERLSEYRPYRTWLGIN